MCLCVCTNTQRTLGARHVGAYCGQGDDDFKVSVGHIVRPSHKIKQSKAFHKHCWAGGASCIAGAVDQTMAHPSMSLWHEGYFELKSTERQQMEEGLSPSLPFSV